MFLARFHPPGRAFVRDLSARSQIEAQQEIKKLLRMRRYNLYRPPRHRAHWGEQLHAPLPRRVGRHARSGRRPCRSPRETDPDPPGAKRAAVSPGGASSLRAGKARFVEETWTDPAAEGLASWVRLAGLPIVFISRERERALYIFCRRQRAAAAAVSGAPDPAAAKHRTEEKTDGARNSPPVRQSTF